MLRRTIYLHSLHLVVVQIAFILRCHAVSQELLQGRESDPLLSIMFPDEGSRVPSSASNFIQVFANNTPIPAHLQIWIDGQAWGSATLQRPSGEIKSDLPSLSIGEHTIAVTIDAVGNGEGLNADETSSFHLDSEVSFTIVDAVDRFPVENIADCDALDYDGVRTCNGDDDCSGHGHCKNFVCICTGDFAGPNCEVDYMKTPSYLPSSYPIGTKWGCYAAKKWYQDSTVLQQKLSQSQNPKACNSSSMRRFGTRIHGFGAQVHFLSEALASSFQSGKAMTASGEWTYANHEECLDTGFECHFKRISTCWENRDQPSIELEHHPEPLSHWVPDTFSGQSILWFRANLASYLLQINFSLEKKLRLFWGAIGLHSDSGPFIGVHVRRGDSCMHGTMSNFKPQCKTFSAYREAIEIIAHKYNVRNVFLATDDPDVMEEARQMVRESNGTLHLLTSPLDRSVFKSDWFLEFRMKYGFVNKQVVSESVLMDLFTLSRSNFFVGTFVSQLSRLAWELASSRANLPIPFVSVDYPWCFHFMEKREVPGFGLRNC